METPTAQLEKLPNDKLRLVFSTWATNLESDEFAQGLHNLRCKDGTWCCLGVLIETMRRMGVIDLAWEDVGTPDGVYAIDGEDQFLPGPVQSLTGMNSNGVIPGWMWVMERTEHTEYDQVESLTYANDEADWDFADIAGAVRRYIERELPS